MNRPKYENEQTLEDERRIAQFVCDKWNAQYHKMLPQYQVDFYCVATTHGKRFLMETKKRNIHYGQFPDVVLSVDKHMKGCQLAAHLAVPFLFVVEMNDGIFYARVDEVHLEHSFLPPITANVADKDSEPVIHVPMSLFKKIGI